MKKNMLLLLCVIFISACEKENVSRTTPGPDPEPKPTDTKSVTVPKEKMSFISKIEDMIIGTEDATSSYPLTDTSLARYEFKEGDKVGVFTADSTNVPYVFSGGKWVAEKYGIPVGTLGSVYVVYPYKAEVTGNPLKADGLNRFIPVNPDEKMLVASVTLTESQKEGVLSFTNPLALVRIVVKRNDYAGKGEMKQVKLTNVSTIGHFQGTPKASVWGVEEKGELGYHDASIEEDHSEILERLVCPLEGTPVFSMILDGSEFHTELKNEWKANHVYTYVINVRAPYDAPLMLKEYNIDYNYWKTAGKDKNIKMLCVNDLTDSSLRTKYSIGLSPIREFGFDTYQNEFKVFQARFSKMENKGDFEGEYRFSLWQGDKLVELFPAREFSLKAGKYHKATMACYVTAAPGHYRLEPMFRAKGDDAWYYYKYQTGIVWGDDKDARNLEWTYDVMPQAPDNLPKARVLKEKGVRWSGAQGYSTDEKNQMDFEVVISNPKKVAIKGELAIFWDRSFQWNLNTYFPSDRVPYETRNDNEWHDLIGKISISIPTGVNGYKGIIHTQFPRREAPMAYEPEQKRWYYLWSGRVLMYFKTEGTNVWKLVRLDPDSFVGENADNRGRTENEEYSFNYVNASLLSWK